MFTSCNYCVIYQGISDTFKILKQMQHFCPCILLKGICWMAKHLYFNWYLNIYEDAWLPLKWNNFTDSPLALFIVKNWNKIKVGHFILLQNMERHWASPLFNINICYVWSKNGQNLLYLQWIKLFPLQKNNFADNSSIELLWKL